MADLEPVTEEEIAEWKEHGSMWFCHENTQRLISEVRRLRNELDEKARRFGLRISRNVKP